MGWIISVGTAGSGNKPHKAQVLGISVDMQGVAARIQVFGDDRQAAGAIPARQAQRILRSVLSTLTDTE